MATEAGQRLSHYRLIEKIGAGGMGVVWKAEDTVLDRTVAIKVLTAEVSRGERRQMFLREAQLAAKVGDASIVQVHEFGRDGDLDFIVMEFVEGRPLNKLIQGRPMPPERVAEIGLQVARALSRAHRKNLVHRDLKPANILITPDGDAKVVDFGLATLLETSTSTLGTDDSTLAAVEQPAADADPAPRLAGTIPYMSPEQVQGKSLDVRTDIFSLGVVLYEMTTGRRPFTGASNGEVMSEILRCRPVPPNQWVGKLPFELGRIVQKTLARRRSDRYQSAEEVAVDLKRLGRDLETGSSPSYDDLATSRGRSGRGWWIGAAAAVVLSAAVIALLALRGDSAGDLDPDRIAVLPFEVEGQQEGAAYVGRAVAQALAVNLVRLEVFSVPRVPESNHEFDAQLDFARQAGAGRMLVGSIWRSRESTRATLQLLDTDSNDVLWGTQEEVAGSDVSPMVSALARRIESELGASRPAEYDVIRAIPAHLDSGLAGSAREVIAAIADSDSATAAALSGRLVERSPAEPYVRALRLWVLGQLHYEAPGPETRRDLEQAMDALAALDAPHPEIVQQRAYLLFTYESRPQDAVDELTALLQRDDLSPRLRANNLAQRANFRARIGQDEEGLSDINTALQLAPAEHGIVALAARTYRAIGNFDRSLELLDRAVALKPWHWNNYTCLVVTYERLGQHHRQLEAAGRAVDLHRSQLTLSLLAIARAVTGDEGGAREAAAEAAGFSDDPYGAGNLAELFLMLRDRDRALEWLRRAISAGFHETRPLEAHWEFLRGDPEFEAIIAELGNRGRFPNGR